MRIFDHSYKSTFERSQDVGRDDLDQSLLQLSPKVFFQVDIGVLLCFIWNGLSSIFNSQWRKWSTVLQPMAWRKRSEHHGSRECSSTKQRLVAPLTSWRQWRGVVGESVRKTFCHLCDHCGPQDEILSKYRTFLDEWQKWLEQRQERKLGELQTSSVRASSWARVTHL